MTFNCRFANTVTRGIFFYPSNDWCEEFNREGPWESTIVDRTVMMVKSDKGVVAGALLPERNGGYIGRANLMLGKKVPGIALFQVDNAEVTIGPNGSIYWDIPLDHTFSWPARMHPEFHTPEICAEQFRMRLKSAVENGASLKDVCFKVPSDFRRQIGNANWASIVREAQSL